MKIRKILSAVTAAAMLLTLTACNSDSESKSSSKKPKRSSSDYESSVEESSIGSSEGQTNDFFRNPFGDFVTSTSSEITPIEPEIDPDIPEAPASDFEYEYNDELGGIEITKYIGDKEIVRIPAKIDGKRVVKLRGSAFRYCSGLTSITIPDSVTEISDGALTTDEYETFTRINVDKNNQNYTSNDGVLYSKDMTSLVRCPTGKKGSFTIPNSVTTIGEGAFYYCSGLTSITIPNSVTEICVYAFQCCHGLTSITIPNRLTKIGDQAFHYCTQLTSITIPSNVKVIGTFAFGNCEELKSVTISNGVTEIGEGAFAYCYELNTRITIPNSVTTIGYGAFYDCNAEITYKGKTYTTDPNNHNWDYEALYSAINGN